MKKILTERYGVENIQFSTDDNLFVMQKEFLKSGYKIIDVSDATENDIAELNKIILTPAPIKIVSHKSLFISVN